MTDLPERCCANCVSWSNTEPPTATGVRQPTGADKALGICRFNPPVPLILGGTLTSMFPQTHASRICDDWMRDESGHGPEGGETVVPFRRNAA